MSVPLAPRWYLVNSLCHRCWPRSNAHGIIIFVNFYGSSFLLYGFLALTCENCIAHVNDFTLVEFGTSYKICFSCGFVKNKVRFVA